MTTAQLSQAAVRRLRNVPDAASNLARSITARSYTRLVLVGDAANWVLSWEMRAVEAIARRCGITAVRSQHALGLRSQSVFYASQFVLLRPEIFRSSNRVAFSYFHGMPSKGEEAFSRCYENLEKNHGAVSRIQVANSKMHSLVLDSGITPEKVHRIPIGIDLDMFPRRDASSDARQGIRKQLGLPEQAVIVGSFQKDGVGWGEGTEPKLIKGPDVFVAAVSEMHKHCDDLFVLLSGPSRGYVKNELTKRGIPYAHVFLKHYPDIWRLYHALDLYLVTSRDEGGPKAVLEAMATGVPLVTTRVGQAADLVSHGVNGWIVDVDDVDGLVRWSTHVVDHLDSMPAIRSEGRKTAEANCYESQLMMWHGLFEGFVESTGTGSVPGRDRITQEA